jgi:hypothetical protein
MIPFLLEPPYPLLTGACSECKKPTQVGFIVNQFCRVARFISRSPGDCVLTDKGATNAFHSLPPAWSAEALLRDS